MPNIEIDNELYRYLASQTQVIGEDANSILRRLLGFEDFQSCDILTQSKVPDMTVTPEVGSDETIVSSVNGDQAVQQKGDKDSPQDNPVLEFIHSRPFQFAETVVDRFLYTLSWIHSHHKEEFYRVENIRGGTRLYFAQSADDLESHGNSTQPQKIPGSTFWVVTNNDSNKKVQILDDVLKEFGYTIIERQHLKHAVLRGYASSQEDIRI